MCFDYDDTCDVYSEQVRVARKRHRCSGCGKPIEAGQRYLNGKGVAGRRAFSMHVCGVCEVMRDRIHKLEMAEGCGWNQSWIAVEDIAEWVQDEEELKGSAYRWPTTQQGQEFLAAKVAVNA